MTTRDESLNRAAAIRAASIAFLNNTPGRHSVRDILNGTKESLKEWGLLKYQQYYLVLQGLATNHQIGVETTTDGNLYFATAATGSTEEPQLKVKVPKEPKSRKWSKEPPDQEVELVIAGVTIVVSKNAVTGRPRITFEV